VSLIDEIIQLAMDDNSPIPTLLRKCLVLAYRLDNAKLKAWVERELKGYAQTDEIPDYRKIQAIAKGFFLGWGGAQIHNQPLPPSVLQQEHRHFAETVILLQPIAAYDLPQHGRSEKAKIPIIEWPPDLTAFYQKKFIDSYVLNRAWQEIAPSSLVALIDTVRNRTLRFALEIQKELGLGNENFSTLPYEKVASMAGTSSLVAMLAT